MKKNVLLSSILVIALCMSLIAGSTFALFTDSSFSEVEVKAGDVTMNANLANLQLFSAQADPNGEEFDENGKTYYYAYQTPQVENGETINRFSNGGTATITEDLITLTNITPGDKITFELEGKNTSNVAIQYRYRIEVIEGFDLMSGCIFTVEGTKYPAMASYDSKWANLAVGQNVEQNDKIELALELPISAGNYFQNLDAKIKLTVEAVQANADMSATDKISVKYITSVNDTTELASKLTSDEYLHIFLNGDLNDTLVVDFDLKNKTIDADDHNLAISFGNGDKANPITLTNVVITNIADTADEIPAVTLTSSVKGDITLKDSKFYSGSNSPYGAVAGNGTSLELDLTVEDCEFYAGTGAVDANGTPISVKERGIYLTNINNLTVRDCDFVGFGTWAIMANGSVNGNIIVSDCTFDYCTGIMKTSISAGTPEASGQFKGNFTFANNVMTNCSVNNCSALKIDCYMSVRNIYGAITFSNNTLQGVVVTPEDMLGIRVANP